VNFLPKPFDAPELEDINSKLCPWPSPASTNSAAKRSKRQHVNWRCWRCIVLVARHTEILLPLAPRKDGLMRGRRAYFLPLSVALANDGQWSADRG
jgi:hypothetical protein